MADQSSSQAPVRYPSPQPSGLPFYEHSHQPPYPPPSESQQVPGASESVAGGMDASRETATGAADAQPYQSLASMMGEYAQYGGQLAHAHPPPGPGQQVFPPGNAQNTPQKQRERTKVSRACDECRRKKIRCDAVDETGATPCSNCARTGATCSFSRQPMKRGPSKGYIKELAERLNTLESQVHAPGGAGVSPQARYEIQQMQQAIAAEGYGRDGLPLQQSYEPQIGDKRTHDMANYGAGTMQVPAAQMQATPNRALHGNSYTPMQSPPRQTMPGEPQPFWRHDGNANRPDTGRGPYDTDLEAIAINFDWDESVMDEYYRLIHQTFPLLPNSTYRLRQRLAECPASLRDAFLAALDCLMRTFPTSTLPPNPNYPQAIMRVAELLAKYPFDKPSSHTNATNLVYLQTLLLMALESDNHGPASIRGQAGPSRAEWLGRAAAVAGLLEINISRPASQSLIEGDRDSEDRLARRVWWVLFILDRWHACSTADLLKLPENSVVLLPEDQIILGESTYHLARLSFIIGHLAAILTTTKTPTTDVMAPSNPASSLLNLALAGEIDRFRESVESVWGSLNLVHLSYHHCHLLIKRLNPATEPSELVGHAVKVATVLNSRQTPVTPLNHHFGALAAMTLCELCDVPKTRAEALKGLDQIIECLGEGRGLAGKQESEGWDGAIRELVVKKKQRMLQDHDGLAERVQGLQGLANAAVNEGLKGSVSENAGDDVTSSFDPTMLTRYGYLTALGQGTFKTR